MMLGKRLNEARKARGFTAQQMADMLYITLSNYRKYESGRAYPPVDKLVQIADILEVSTDYLLCRYDNVEGDNKRGTQC